MENNHILIDLGELIDICKIKKTSIYKLIKENKFPLPYKLGSKKVYWKKNEILEWIDNLKN